MAYTTIDDPSEYFTITLYTGDGQANRTVTNGANAGNFQPDWLWIKGRSHARHHHIYDSNRGATKWVQSSNGDNEATQAEAGVNSFDSNGFTEDAESSNYGFNINNETYVAWQWKCNGGTTASNTDGDITSTVQANTEAGFSIVTYAGNSNGSDQTVGHGLGSTCKLVLQKNLTDDGSSWRVYHESVSAAAGGTLFLNGTSEVDAGDNGGDPARIKSTNASTITLLAYSSGYNAVNGSGKNYLAYCFAEKQGYSRIGTYTGNGQNAGTFMHTGFKPAWVIIKRADAANQWRIYDHKRLSAFNPVGVRIIAETAAAESVAGAECDFLSNGIKIRSNSSGVNTSGGTYIYAAFAERPFVSSEGVPTTAR